MSTEKPRPLQGYRESQEIKKDTPVDPKKFQEELNKVRETDESQQKSKRNLKKSEEETEEDELNAKKAQIQASGALFSMFMKDSSDSGLLSPQTPQNVRGSQAPTSSSQFIIEQDSTDTSAPAASPTPALSSSAPQTPPISQPLSSQPPSIPIPLSSGIQQPPQEPGAVEQPPAAASTQPSYQQPTTTPPLPSYQDTSMTISSPSQNPSLVNSDLTSDQSPQRVEKKQVQDTSLFAKNKAPKSQVLKQKQEKNPELHLDKKEEAPRLEPQKEKMEDTKEAAPTKPAPFITKPSTPLGAKALEPTEVNLKKTDRESLLKEKTPLAAEESVQVMPTTQGTNQDKPLSTKTKESSSLEGIDKPVIKTEKQSSDDSSKDHKDKEKEKEEAAASSLTLSPVLTPFAPAPIPQAPAYAMLPPQIYELFERMVGIMTIEQTKGVTTTTVTINMKNSIFDGAQIVLDHYSTAPNAFNVTIAASPNAQAFLTSNIESLAAAFQGSKLSFEINLKKPILLEEYQAFKRKGKVGEEGREQQGQNK